MLEVKMAGGWVLSAVVAGCWGGPTAFDTAPSYGAATGITIRDVQQGRVGEGSVVTLVEVIVTSPMVASGDGFFIQDEGGGESSGIRVRFDGVMDAVDVAVGDRVTVQGTFLVSDSSAEISVTAADDVVFLDAGHVVVTDAITAADLDVEAWEGGLVSLGAVQVWSVSDAFGQVHTSAAIDLGGLFGVVAPGPGAACVNLTGLLTVLSGMPTIAPRDEADLAGCSGEGVIPEVTVSGIRMDPAWDDHTVRLSSVVASSGMTQDRRGFFVQDPGSGAWGGVFVADLSASLGVAAGDGLDLTGTVSDARGFTEVVLPSPVSVVVTATDLPVSVSAVAVDAPDWTSWEGQLVALGPIQVTGEADAWGQYPLENGLYLGDLFGEPSVALGDELSWLTGILVFGTLGWTLEPRDDADLSGTE